MGKHHTEVCVEKLNNFDWITMYKKTGSVVRKTRKNRVAYKVGIYKFHYRRTQKVT